MKKSKITLILITLIISAVLSVTILVGITLGSGSKDPEPTPSGDTTTSVPPPHATETIYDKLDDFADLNYQKIKLTIVTVTGDIQLSANYTLTQSNVSYSVEQLNMLPSNGDFTGISPEYKTTHTGYAKIVDGKVTELDGEVVTLPSYDELKGNFSFAESNFKNVTTQGNSLSADIDSPSSFYGSTVNVQNMKVTVEYTETALSKIVITYQTANSTVMATYEFAV